MQSLETRLRYLNRAFPYFTHHTFDFEMGAPFRANDFSPGAYLETICQGVHTLMRRGSLTRRRRPRSTTGPGEGSEPGERTA